MTMQKTPLVAAVQDATPKLPEGNRKHMAWTREEEDECIRLYEQGKSYTAIGRHLHRTSAAVGAKLVELRKYLDITPPPKNASRHKSKTTSPTRSKARQTIDERVALPRSKSPSQTPESSGIQIDGRSFLLGLIAGGTTTAAGALIGAVLI